jgi:glycosyltransferase involved in cell wall biosynthesis
MGQDNLGWVAASESGPDAGKRQEGYRNAAAGCGGATGSVEDETANLADGDGLSQSGTASERRSTGGAATSPGDTTGVDQEGGRRRGENRRLSAENSELRSAYQALSREEQALRVELFSMKDRLAALEPSYRALVEQARAYERSLGWTLIKKARNVRRRIFRDGRVSGRCWHLFSRFAATVIDSGPRLAVRKAVRKIRRKFAGAPSAPEIRGIERTRVDDPSPAWPGGFLELPWRYLGERSPEVKQKRGHFKVLLVSHEASRTGAPLCLLKLAERLTRLPDVECWVVLKRGGELADAFARLAPTLDIDALALQGLSVSQKAGIIARRYRDYSSRGIAICNSAEVSDFHVAFAEHKTPVLAWVHELGVSIAHLGGQAIVDRISAASRRIIVPADAVRDALIARYAISPDRLRTVYYGLEPRTRDLAQERPIIRRRVRRELGIPEDAPIVLGCGTTDFRKGVDLFAQLCRLVLRGCTAGEPASKAWFVWVGAFGTSYSQKWLLHDAQHGACESRLVFTGPRETTVPYFLAADLFALTSREDPCPFVNLEAMESGLAVVAFEDSGGAPEVLKGAGTCVPYLDVGAMANMVRELLSDPARRTAMGQQGQATIREHFTWDRFMKEFTGILRTDFGHRPSVPLKVSVIVPNYRHARYLEHRLRSIFNQTLRPHEIIFLDNASPDDSVEVARRLSRESLVPMRIIVNERNNGSTFRQWMKGLSVATGDLVWIAEADDACHPQLLERLVPEFYDPEVALAYCQSAIVGPEGELLSGDFLEYTDDLSHDRWRSPFSGPGIEEVELALSQKNTIPNASAVLFRRPTDRPDFADELENLRFAGDWLFYAMQLRGGNISYVPEVLNLFRRHPQTNTHQLLREDTFVEEILYVRARIFESFPVSMNAIASSLGQAVVEYNHLTRQFDMNRPVFSANPGAQSALERIRKLLRLRHDAGGRTGLGILLVASDLGRSGEPSLAIRLANALSSNHRVFLCNARPSDYIPDLAGSVSQEVVFLEGTLGPTRWVVASDGPGEGSLSGQSSRCKILSELIRIHEIDVIHSHSRTADCLVLDIMEGLDIPWFTHLDGSTEDRDSSILLRAVQSAMGVFLENGADVSAIGQLAHRSGPRLIDLPAHLDIDSIAWTCSLAYAEACELRRRQARESTGPVPRAAEPRTTRQCA